MSKKNLGRLSVAVATLLTGTTVKASNGLGVTEGGTRQLGINALTLNQIPLQNTSVCVNESSMASKTGNLEDLTNEVSVVIHPFGELAARVRFLVSEVHPDKKDRTLILVYSTGVLPSPPIPSPLSMNKLLLNLDGLGVLGEYFIPATELRSAPETSIGLANPSPRINFGIDISLDTAKIAQLVALGSGAIYMQAVLMPAEDWKQGKLDNMILSEVDTVYFAENQCLDGQVTFSGSKSGDVSMNPTKSESDKENAEKVTISGKTGG